MSSSRRMTREYLLQSLYARSEMRASFHQMHFYDAFFRDEVPFTVDDTYFQLMEDKILQNEQQLLGIINRLAPKFDLSTMPVIHILILIIALTEILYAQSLNIPESVSINEAIELAKKFSDDHGKAFVNGSLSTFLKEKDILLATGDISHFTLFSDK